ncbi:MAG: LysR family transcriptional regulator [Hyphomicrobiaceae bacterium]
MRGFNLDQLQTFVDVIAHGSFSAAAERLNVSQPAVSLQIRQLEKRLGVRLIERVGKRATPTPAGAELLRHARQIDQLVTAARDSMVPHAKGVAGRVRVGTGATACIYVLPTILRTLRKRFPDLEVIVSTGNSADILRQLEDNDLDVAVVTLPAPGRMFDVTPLFDDEVVLLAPKGDPLPERITAAALAARPLVLYESGAHTRKAIDTWFAKSGRAAKPIMELGNVEAIKEIVGAGLGWGMVPALAAPQGKSGLVSRSLTPRLARRLGLVLRRDKPLHRGLRETVAEIRRAAGVFSGRRQAGGSLSAA